MRDFQHPLQHFLDGNVFQGSKDDLQGLDSLHKVRYCLELVVFFGFKIVEYYVNMSLGLFLSGSSPLPPRDLLQNHYNYLHELFFKILYTQISGLELILELAGWEGNAMPTSGMIIRSLDVYRYSRLREQRDDVVVFNNGVL